MLGRFERGGQLCTKTQCNKVLVLYTHHEAFWLHVAYGNGITFHCLFLASGLFCYAFVGLHGFVVAFIAPRIVVFPYALHIH